MAKRVKVDPKQVEKLAAKFWEVTEIAAFFDCDEGTIRHTYSEAVAKGREVGKGYLRDFQLKAAKKGSAALLIWLGKQYLDQKEKIEITNTELMREEIEIIPINGKLKAALKNRISHFLTQ